VFNTHRLQTRAGAPRQLTPCHVLVFVAWHRFVIGETTTTEEETKPTAKVIIDEDEAKKIAQRKARRKKARKKMGVLGKVMSMMGAKQKDKRDADGVHSMNDSDTDVTSGECYFLGQRVTYGHARHGNIACVPPQSLPSAKQGLPPTMTTARDLWEARLLIWRPARRCNTSLIFLACRWVLCAMWGTARARNDTSVRYGMHWGAGRGTCARVPSVCRQQHYQTSEVQSERVCVMRLLLSDRGHAMVCSCFCAPVNGFRGDSKYLGMLLTELNVPLLTNELNATLRCVFVVWSCLRSRHPWQ